MGVQGFLLFSFAFGRDLPPYAPAARYFGKNILRIEYLAEPPPDRTHFDPYIGVRPGDPLTRAALKKAIQSLYDSGLFSSIVAEVLPDAEGVRLQFRLEYNYYFNEFSIEGDFDLKGRSLWEWVSLPVGKRYTPEALEESRQTVLKFLNDRGYYLAEVQSRTERDDTNMQVNVVFQVRTGKLARIRAINIVNVPERDAGKLLEKFGFHAGEDFERSRLADRMENLRNYFIDKGFLGAVVEVDEHFDPGTNSVAPELIFYNYASVRVVVDGYDIDRSRMQRLMSTLTRAEDKEKRLAKGAALIKEYLEGRGYPEAKVTLLEGEENDVYVLRYKVETGSKITIQYVRFEGSTVFTDREMIEAAGVRPSSFLQSSPFSRTLLDEGADNLKSLYESRGYLAADISYKIDRVDDRHRVNITYLCREGSISRIHSVEIQGNTALGKEELLSTMGLRTGSAYSPSLAERARQVLLAAYNDAGFLQARTTVHAAAAGEETDSWRVVFQVEEGTRFIVDRILVLGNLHTRRSVIDGKIKLKTGDSLSLGKLLETQQALYRLGIFDQVRVVQQNPDSQNPYQNIVIRLRESKRFTVRYGLGYREREKIRGTLEFSDLNLLGLARRADIRLRGSSTEQQAVFNLRQTQFQPLPVDSYLSFSASYRQDVSFDIRRLGASYQFSHPLSDHSWGLVRYNFQNVRSFNLQIAEPEYEREDIPRNLSTFSIAYVNDSRDNYLDPVKGFFSSTDFGLTTKLLGDNDYLSFFTQNSYYRKLPKSFMTAASLRIGVMQPFGGSNVPVSERFFAGGASSLRGFETDYAGPLDPETYKPTGGNALVIGSVELRRPILSFVHFAVFYDTGNIFETPEDIDFSLFSHTMGAGLRIKTPFGPLRIDYGYNLNLPRELEFPEPPLEGLNRGHLFITVGPPF